MKELDVLLERYMEHRYDVAPVSELDLFDELLGLQDPVLYRLLTARERSERDDLQALIETIRATSVAVATAQRGQ